MKRSILSENVLEKKNVAKMESEDGSNSREKVAGMDEEVLVAENLSIHIPQKKGRKFKEEWLSELRWLRYDPGTGSAQCALCNKFPTISRCTSKVVKGFTGPFKLETFKKHEKSHQHQKCVSRDGVEMEKFDDLKLVFNVAYYIAKNNKPFSDIDGLFTLVEKLGVYLGDEDHYNEGCQEFINNISNVFRQDLIREISDQPFVSLFIDGSTDKIGDEEISMYVRYVQNKEVKDAFLSCFSIKNHNACDYFHAIRNEMEKLNLSRCLNSNVLIGIGMDGTPNMVQAQNGFERTMREHLPHLIGLRSIAYRLNYSLLSTIKNEAVVDDIDSIFKMLYNFYRSSRKRLRQLNQFQAEDLHRRIVKFDNVNSIRWMVCKLGVLTSLMKDWKYVIQHLESVVAEVDYDSSTVASELLEKLKDFKFLHMLQFLIDYLDNFKRLSQVFEKPNIFINTVVSHVENTVAKLASLKDTPGYHEINFLSNISIEGIYQTVKLHGFENWSIQKIKENIVQNGIEYLNERFLSNIDRLDCTSIFDSASWPTGEDLEMFGREEIRSLAQQFHKQLCYQDTSKEDVGAELLNEWCALKEFGKGLHFNQLLKKVLSDCESFPILSKLMHIVAVLPISTLTCQRGFHVMNDIENKFRTSMEMDSLNDLMFIRMNGPPINEFDPSKAVEHWLFSVKGVETM